MVSFKATLLALAGAATVSADYWINVTNVPLGDRRELPNILTRLKIVGDFG